MDIIEFKSVYEKIKVLEHSNNVTEKPIVSICVQTYQHSRYIAKCLDNILKQKTNFDFEILLGEDNSIDGTREICIDYANRYPDKIRLFLHHRDNNIKVEGKPTGRFNFLYNLYSAKGKYIALCEGDDYWIDVLKLQKQVDFLELNKNYNLVHSDVNIHIEQINKVYSGINKNKNRNILSGDVFIDKLKTNFRIFTCTTMFRNNRVIISTLLDYKNNLQGDLVLYLEMAKVGYFQYFDEPLATYRINQGGITQSTSPLEDIIFKQSSLNIRLTVAKKYNVKPSIIGNLIIEYNKLMIELAYIKVDKELMTKTLQFLNEKGVLLNRDQKYKASIVLDKGVFPIIKKMILEVSTVKSNIVGRLSYYKNKYIIK